MSSETIYQIAGRQFRRLSNGQWETRNTHRGPNVWTKWRSCAFRTMKLSLDGETLETVLGVARRVRSL